MVIPSLACVTLKSRSFVDFADFVSHEKPEFDLAVSDCLLRFLSFFYSDNSRVCPTPFLSPVLNVFHCEPSPLQVMFKTLSSIPLRHS